MDIYIAFLRGINVGGNNIILMKDLKNMFVKMGYPDVQTYIQSGNIIFHSDEKEEIVCSKIEKEIEETFGCKVAVVLRTRKELEELVISIPFSDKAIIEKKTLTKLENLYVALLKKAPLVEDIECLSNCNHQKDAFIVKGREVYLLFEESIRNSRLTVNLNKLNTPHTIRNWKTINKLYELVKEIK